VRRLKKLGRRTVAVMADVAVATDVARFVAAVEAALGPVAILVNNAGITRPQPITEIPNRTGTRTISSPLTGPFCRLRADSISDLSVLVDALGPHGGTLTVTGTERRDYGRPQSLAGFFHSSVSSLARRP